MEKTEENQVITQFFIVTGCKYILFLLFWTNSHRSISVSKSLDNLEFLSV